jgi:mRNA degradation ribonuclease J1/J2
MVWSRRDFANAMGWSRPFAEAYDEKAKPGLVGRFDVDPATRGAMALTSSAELDGYGGADNLQIKYWYRRPNGHVGTIHLLEMKTALVPSDSGEHEIEIEEVWYRNKPLLEGLPDNVRTVMAERLREVFQQLTTHLRENGSPAQALKIMNDFGLPDIVGEDIKLPGQKKDGGFHFNLRDLFNPRAKGEIVVGPDPDIARTVINAGFNSVDAHCRIDEGFRESFATHTGSGTTYRARIRRDSDGGTEQVHGSLEPHVVPEGYQPQTLKDFFQNGWKRLTDGSYVLDSVKLLGHTLTNAETDMKLRALGFTSRMEDLFRRRRFPTGMEALMNFGLMDLISPVDPPPPEGRFVHLSLLGDGKEEVVDGFGQDLGACKIVMHEWMDEQGVAKRTAVCLDLGMLLPRNGSRYDGAVPDVVALLKDIDTICISHRHLDHMDGILVLARLGLLKGKKICGGERAMWMLEHKLKQELQDKSLMPEIIPLKGEGQLKISDTVSMEYCVEGMDHSTPSTMYRVHAKGHGSYLFYGDGRKPRNHEFLSRGLRGFGIDRQDTIIDVDGTNAHKDGRVATEEDAQKNLIDLMQTSLFKGKGTLFGMISTNDSRVKTVLKACNRVGRNCTAVGANIENTLTMHNQKGVDPEIDTVYDRLNINNFLEDDATKETKKRTKHLHDRLEREKIEEEIESLVMHPVEFRTRGSGIAQSWLDDDLGELLVFVTGTQGNPEEMFATLSRFAEGWSTLDANPKHRHTAYKIDPKKFNVTIDQSAIPGNEENQRKMIDKMLRNRGVNCVIVAMEDGFRVHGLSEEKQEQFKKEFAGEGRDFYNDKDGCLTVTGATIHPSGHGYLEDLRETITTAKADITHVTHTNKLDNIRRVQQKICEPAGLRHTGRQFNTFEFNQIEMGNSREDAKVTRIGQGIPSLILFEIIREVGQFFGGALKAERFVKLDARSGSIHSGLMAGAANDQFTKAMAVGDFNAMAAQTANDHRNKRDPFPAQIIEPPDERRYQGVQKPSGDRPKSLADKIRKAVARELAA